MLPAPVTIDFPTGCSTEAAPEPPVVSAGVGPDWSFTAVEGGLLNFFMEYTVTFTGSFAPLNPVQVYEVIKC